MNKTEEIKIISVMLLFHGSNTNIHFSLVRTFREKLYSLANGNCDCRDIGLGGIFKTRPYLLKQEHFRVLHVNRNFNGTWEETLTWAKCFRLEIRLKAISLIARPFDYRHIYINKKILFPSRTDYNWITVKRILRNFPSRSLFAWRKLLLLTFTRNSLEIWFANNFCEIVQ